ncbi:MAG TPA: hypothetical protein P5089_02980 [Candidatus Portnoybacteria bacterium]|nr:hypothetical protein [Candidatus Portnoybacteria bacterium]
MERKNIVRTIFGALILFFSFSFWLYLERSLNDGGTWWEKTICPLILFLVLTAILGLYYFLENEKKYLLAAAFLTLTPFLFFAQLKWSLLWFVLAIYFLVNCIFKVTADKKETVDLEVVRILRKATSAAASSILLLTTLIFYWAPYAQSLKSDDINVPRPVFNTITSQLVQKISGLENMPAADSLSSRQQQDEVYKTVNEQVGDWLGDYRRFLPAVLALSVFFTLKFIGFFLAWPAIFLAWLAYKILLWRGIVKINKTQVQKEGIEI